LLTVPISSSAQLESSHLIANYCDLKETIVISDSIFIC